MSDIIDELRSLALSLTTKSSTGPALIEDAITEICVLRVENKRLGNEKKHLQDHITQCHGHDVDFMNSLINGD